MLTPEPLPIDDHLREIRARVDERRALVLSAAPGSGKSTRVPPALIDRGPVILLQPRRVAARAIAARIAAERGWTLGREVGWQIRFERRFSAETRLLVVTEGILTARLQHDPLLSDFATVVFDEFHERSIHADLGLALARHAWLARDDLRLVVMSATLDAEPVAGFLDGAAAYAVPGAPHPLTIEYGPGESVAAAAGALAARGAGHVLCFLPGRSEIEQARTALSPLAASGVEVLPLHGSLDAAAQDAALRPASGRRIVLATNIAETSLTVPGVSAVVDSGLVKIARYDVGRGVDSLSLERVTFDSADQRAGRAARLGPGVVRRLWSERDRLRPRREPEVMRVDLAGPLLALIAWGGTPSSFEWFERPPADRLDAALRLLERLGAIDDSAHPRLTPVGRHLQRMPVHPRLARILLDGRGAPEVAAACALLTDAIDARSNGGVATTCDLLPLIDAFDRQPYGVRQTARQLRRIAADVLQGDAAAHASDEALRHALFTGYGDRLARRRASALDKVTLASGHGALLARESGIRDFEYLVALDVVAAERGGVEEARIRLASRVEREWIEPTATTIEHRLDERGRVRAFRVARWEALVLGETPAPVDPAVAAPLLRDAWLARAPGPDDAALLRRLRFAGIEVDERDLASRAAAGATALDEIAIAAHLPFEVTRALAAQAPVALVVPSGRSIPLAYGDDGSVAASVKLQELFGLAESPAIGPRRVPVTFHLLAPNGRPVQTTRDLRSFWERTYPEVRKELRGRYPKHPWPEDPWTARPTHRTTPRR